MAEVKDAAAAGMPVLGICNGFQMLVEAQLLPGGLIRNAHQQFVRRDQRLRVENASTAWTSDFTEGQEIVIPLKNADGGYIAAESELDRLEGEGLVAFRYVGVNPNGSLRDIAGPHERARQRRRPHAAPRARRRGGLRPEHCGGDALRAGRRAVLHLGDRRRGGRRGLSRGIRPPRSRSLFLRETAPARRDCGVHPLAGARLQSRGMAAGAAASMSCRMRAATLTAMDAGALPATSGMPIGVVTRARSSSV